MKNAFAYNLIQRVEILSLDYYRRVIFSESLEIPKFVLKKFWTETSQLRNVIYILRFK